MNDTVFTVSVPNIGDFENVDVVEVLVTPGDAIEVESPLITLESDKATMDIPSPVAGEIMEVLAPQGGRVSQGDPVAKVMIQRQESPTLSNDATPVKVPIPPASDPNNRPDAYTPAGEAFDLAVLGSGPGGYTAAFRAADLGLKVCLIERYSTLGGVCLNVGCIPSKALLHAARVIEETREMRAHGIEFGEPKIDLTQLSSWKDKVVDQLTSGLSGLAKKREVRVITGSGRFESPHELRVLHDDGEERVHFRQAIIAAGSQAMTLPGLPEDPRIFDSTGALALESIPPRMLVIGGGIIGLEMATVYLALGSKISIVEMAPQLMPGSDSDLVKPLVKRLNTQCDGVYLGTRVTNIEADERELSVSFEGDKAPVDQAYDAILVAVGRSPNGHNINADAAGIVVDDRGFIAVDSQQRTNQPHIFAIGDIVGQPMLAHKATHEGKAAAEVAAGRKSGFDARVIPSVAYTDPEVAWVGLTETDARDQGIEFHKAVFPWAASGRALALARSEGFTKLLFDPVTQQIIGGGIVGPNAGDLIAEVGLAIEMNCVAQDVGLTVHPHPTLSETIALAAEAFEGTITDLYLPRKR